MGLIKNFPELYREGTETASYFNWLPNSNSYQQEVHLIIIRFHDLEVCAVQQVSYRKKK